MNTKTLIIALSACLLAPVLHAASPSEQPNILWIIVDDMSANFGCYGETAIETPHVDRLADQGVTFTNAYVTAPVCSTCRSAFITGMYQTTIGAHHHRSGRGELKIHLPENIRMIPEIFQQAGYYTSISGWPIVPRRMGKTDYNFEWDKSVYDGVDWRERADGQPFFHQVQTPGGKLRGKDASGWDKVQSNAEKTFGSRTPDSAVSLPPYYPGHPDIIRDWAAYLDSVRMTDHMVGEVLAMLEEEGELDNTLVLFMTDHGISHARGKQFLYDEGLHVPLVIMGPGIEAGSVRVDPVEHIDIAALSLAAAGIPIPDYMQAKDILNPHYQYRDAVYSARDRCDETVEHLRSVRTDRYKYIKNYLPERPHLQPNRYKDAKEILIALRDWHGKGKLDGIQELLFAPSRSPEELYDLENDPFEINNLAGNPEYAHVLTQLRQEHETWVEETDDKGRFPESEEMYDSDMAEYFRNYKDNPDSPDYQVLKRNIAQMKKWAAEGK